MLYVVGTFPPSFQGYIWWPFKKSKKLLRIFEYSKSRGAKKPSVLRLALKFLLIKCIVSKEKIKVNHYGVDLIKLLIKMDADFNKSFL